VSAATECGWPTVGFLFAARKLVARQVFAHFVEGHQAHPGRIFVRAGRMLDPGPGFIGHVGIVDHFALADADVAVIDAFETALLCESRLGRPAAAD
jgi:hypothetical protein